MSLEVEGICSGYGDFKVVHDFSMHLDSGEIACIVGPNGSGKSTILKTIAGIVKPTEGRIVFDGEDITRFEPWEVLGKGICLMPQGRTAFEMMTVLQNLEMGAYSVKHRRDVKERVKEAYRLFPVLEQRRNDIARKLSGGELVMLCIARALMSHPKMMMFDEPSLGLSPILIDKVYQKIAEISRNGSSIVIVEQNVRKVLNVADYAYVVNLGRKVFEGKSEALASDDRLKNLFLGALPDESQRK